MKGRTIGGILLAACLCATASAAAKPTQRPRDPLGHPDLSGDWTNLSGTDFERSDRFKHLVLTPKEAADYERIQNDPELFDQFIKAQQKTSGRTPPDVGGAQSQYVQQVRMMRVHGQIRSSIITEPKDGQIPYSKAGKALMRAAHKREAREFSNPEYRPVEERCLLGSGEPLGPPLGPQSDNAAYVIVENRGAVAIEGEKIHDVRLIRLNARHSPPQIRPWMGDSIGWWRGRTLKVETTNFNPAEGYTQTSGGSFLLSDQAKVTEWFTRTSANAIFYRFRVEDPKTYSKPWVGEMTLQRSSAPMMEYACHEGNYSLRGILAGARKAEAEGKTPEFIDGGDPPPKPDTPAKPGKSKSAKAKSGG